MPPDELQAPAPVDPGDPPAAEAPKDWHDALDVGAEAPPPVDVPQLEEVVRVAAELEAPPPGPVAPPGPVTPDRPVPGGPGGPGPAPSPRPEPLVDPAARWSKRKVERSKPAELRRRVLELQEHVATMAPPPALAVDAPPAASLEERVQLIAGALQSSFRLAGGMAARMFGSKHLEISEAEARELATAWSPIAVQHFDTIAQYAPWAMALGVTYEIGAPKIAGLTAERAERKKLAEAQRGHLVGPDGPVE